MIRRLFVCALVVLMLSTLSLSGCSWLRPNRGGDEFREFGEDEQWDSESLGTGFGEQAFDDRDFDRQRYMDRSAQTPSNRDERDEPIMLFGFIPIPQVHNRASGAESRSRSIERSLGVQ